MHLVAGSGLLRWHLSSLAGLGDVGVGAEVGQVARSAWLAYSTAWVSVDQPSVGQSPDVVVEGRAGQLRPRIAAHLQAR